MIDSHKTSSEGDEKMKQNVMIFIIAFVVAFGGGYLFFKAKEPADVATPKTEQPEQTDGQNGSDEQANEEPQTISAEVEILDQKSCLSCHSVEAFGVKDAMSGPDLSDAYVNVEGKHGKPLDEFLKEPTSAVMSSVIAADPLTDEERAQIIEVLKAASEK